MLGLIARLIDIALVVTGALCSHALYFEHAHKWRDVETFLVLLNCVLTLMVFPAFGIYRSWRGKSFSELVLRSIGAWCVVVSAGLLLVFAVRQLELLSRAWTFEWAATSGALLVLGKWIVNIVLARLRIGGRNQRSVAILGASNYCHSLIHHLALQPRAGFRPVCVLTEDIAPSDSYLEGIPRLPGLHELTRMVRRRRVDEIWLALPLSEEVQIMSIVREFRHDLVNIRFIPDVRSLSLFNHSIVDLIGLPAINLAASPINELDFLPKKVFDRVFAALVLVMLSPILVVIAAAVKGSSPGPVFFQQKRKGMDGKEFKIFKFRSMKVHEEVAGRLTQASKRDSRITSVGAFLRRTSLDELPQFLNVLRGEMSVVGPRPHALEHDDMYKDLVEGYMHRYRIKPGITGWAQVNGFRGETAEIEKMEGRVKLDLYYIQNWSIWLDLKIIVMTIVRGFVDKNAY